MKSISVSSSRIRQLFALGSLASIVSLLGVAVPTRLAQAQVGATAACTAYPETLKNDFWSYYIFDDMQWTNSDLNTGRIAVGGTFTFNNANFMDGAPNGGFGNNGDCSSAPTTPGVPDIITRGWINNANTGTNNFAFHNGGIRYMLSALNGFSTPTEDFTAEATAIRATRCAAASAPTANTLADDTAFNTLTNMDTVEAIIMGVAATTVPDGDASSDTPGSTGDTIAGCTGTALWNTGFGGAAAPDPNPDYGSGFKHPADGYSYDRAVAGGVGATAVTVGAGGTTINATSPSGALVTAHKIGNTFYIDTTASSNGDVYVNIPVDPSDGDVSAPLRNSTTGPTWNITLKPSNVQNLIINFVNKGSSAVVLVGGTSGTMTLTGGDESNLLFNAPNTPQVYLGDPMSAVTFNGTIMAPCGQVLTKGINFTLVGQVVAAKGSPGGYGKVTGNGFCSPSPAPTLLTLDGVRVSNNNISSIAFASISTLLLLAGGALLLSKRITR